MTEHQHGSYFTRRNDELLARVRQIKEQGVEPLPVSPYRCPLNRSVRHD